MNILLIGFGSIGSRHFNILKNHSKATHVDIVSRSFSGALYKQITELDLLKLAKYDLFYICSETSLHAEQLSYIDQRVNGKTILVEKPLASTTLNYFPNNRVLVTYNLRFHPVIQKLKELLTRERILSFSVSAGQYLPIWRPSQDYKLSYSADLKFGGGVLRDLSHEIDYTIYLCGDLTLISAIANSNSHLDLKSDDLCTILATNKYSAHVQIQMDYLSFRSKREIDIQTDNVSISASLISNEIKVFYKDGKQENFNYGELERDFTYQNMHADIIENSGERLTNYTEANAIMLLIDNITNNYMDKSWG